MTRVLCQIVSAFIFCCATGRTLASVTVYSDKAAWQIAAGSYNTITFTELPAFTWLTDQYADLGVYFTDGSDQTDMSSNGYADNFGLNGAFDESTLDFANPTYLLGLEFPGAAKVTLLLDGKPIFTSPIFGGGGVGHFGGIISTEPFDEAYLSDPFGGLFIDNIYFGPPIPAPGALTLLALGFTLRGRRRRPA